MGVPALFRWLSKKYPKIISPVIEEEPILIGDVEQPTVYSNPNPNGELDNLYLDMNGIVHPCSHPENKPPPETEDEMMVDIFKYTDRVLNMARPRKLLMIAVDGVAPRAKMNQQRSRRFRSAKDAKIAQEEKERKISEMESRGELIDDVIKGKKHWDSNAITPGTPFMDILAASLRYWVSYKLATDPGWADLQVIISDATVPGEGEHKIMNFIRSQRSDPQYNPNTSHCIYGLDADLIFLGLATHEPHFKVLREDVFAKDNLQRQLKFSDQVGMDEETKQRLEEMDKKKPFLWLHISVLREYLEVELNIPRLPFTFDIERAIDDWIFMCFFVGNDFLPHLPSLSVRDNGIDLLVNIWKRNLPRLKTYMTCDGSLNLEGVEVLLGELSKQEDEIFRKRREGERRREENFKRRKFEEQQQVDLKNQLLKTVSKGKDKAPLQPHQNIPLYNPGGNLVGGLQLSNSDVVKNITTISKANMANKSAAEILRQSLMNKSKTEDQEKSEEKDDSEYDPSRETSEPIDVSEDSNKRKLDESNSESTTVDDSEEEGDSIKLWEPGYRNRYYQEKFHTKDEQEINRIKKDMTYCYIQGVSWVLLYYYQGCPSWNWYYPYHYAPFAADFNDLSSMEITFKLGKPFHPFEQLMSVLPAASGHHLPEIFRPLMSDENSEIVDFYPEDFTIDMNGEKMAWKGVALLPFIDETRLLKVVRDKYQYLTDAELERNSLKGEVLYVGSKSKLFKKLNQELYSNKVEELTLHSSTSGLSGKASVAKDYDAEIDVPFHLNCETDKFMPVPSSTFMKVDYRMPPKLKGKSMILNGFIPHLRLLKQEDRDAIMYYNGRFNRNRNNFERKEVIDYKPHVGPHGKDSYTLRVGGYKGFINAYEEEKKRQSYGESYYGAHNTAYQAQQQSGYNNYSQGNQNNSYHNQNGGYNNSRYNNNNQGGNNRGGNNYNNNYSNNYNNNYSNNNYDNNNNNYNNNRNSYNNYNNRGNYNNNRGYNNNSNRYGGNQKQNQNNRRY